MTFSLTWLPNVLENAGLKVAPVKGWETRGRGDVGHIFGVLCHHTAGPRNENMPSLNTLIKGRGGSSPLPGPLAQLGLARDGTYFVIAAGRAIHAGKGEFRGVVNGNSNFIGIEAENTGLSNDLPWPEVQLDAYHRGVAAILKHIGRGAEFCAGHKEYALTKSGKRGRKSDPDLDMDEFRAAVAAIMSGTAPTPTLIPAVEPPIQPGAPAGRPTLRRRATGDLVKQVQGKVGVIADGTFGSKTEAALRNFQRTHGLTPDGIVGPRTWGALDTVADPTTP
jgi:peptidoglycan hydrolase-like protein with peptidoglycan-binding domain